MSWFTTWFGGDTSEQESSKKIGKKGTCIVLDMDECLLHTWDGRDLSRSRYLKNLNTPKSVSIRRHFFEFFPDETNKFNSWYGVMRPGLVEFLEYSFHRFDKVVIWTASVESYAIPILDLVFSKTDKVPKNVLTRTNCEESEEGFYSKPLEKFFKEFDQSLSLDCTYFVDDNPDSGIFNKDNHILIPRFDPDPNIESIEKALATDRALYDLIEWFESEETKNCEDVRKLDKSKIFKKH